MEICFGAASDSLIRITTDDEASASATSKPVQMLRAAPASRHGLFLRKLAEALSVRLEANFIPVERCFTQHLASGEELCDCGGQAATQSELKAADQTVTQEMG